jgi:hypothetical protein
LCVAASQDNGNLHSGFNVLQDALGDVFASLLQYLTRSSPLLPDSDLRWSDFSQLGHVWRDNDWQQVRRGGPWRCVYSLRYAQEGLDVCFCG